MKHEIPPRLNPVLNLARTQMEAVTNIHLVHLAIVSGRAETQVLQFKPSAFNDLIAREIPALVREIDALCVILSSPLREGKRYGAVVTIVDRALEAFSARIVRITNADTMVGDFRAVDVCDPAVFKRIHEELSLNWHKHRD